MALQLRRGTNAERLAMTPVNGELIFVTDYELVSTSVTSINTTTDTLTTTAAHGLSVNQQVKYIGATLNGLTADQVYFVKTAPTITTFTLSTTLAGSTLDITGSFTVDLVFAKTPTTAAGVPLGEGVAILWIGDGATVGGVIAASMNLDDLLDVEITAVAEGNTLYYDATTGLWKNTAIITVDDVTNNVTLLGDLAVNGGDITTTVGAGGIANLYNSSAIGTINIGNSVVTEVNIGNAASGRVFAKTPSFETQSNATVGGNLTVTGDVAVNGGDITTTQTTGNLFNATATTVNIGNGATTEVNLGSPSAGQVQIKSPSIVGANTTQAVFNTVATTVNAFGASTATAIGSTASGTTTIGYNANILNDLTVTGGDIDRATAGQANIFNVNANEINIGNSSLTTRIGQPGVTNTVLIKPGILLGEGTTQNVFNTVATTVNAFGASTATAIGSTASGTTTIGYNATIGNDLTVTGGDIDRATAGQGNIFNVNANDINIGNGAGTTRIGAPGAGNTVIIKPGQLIGDATTQAVFNTVATTVNAFGAASTALNMGHVSGLTTVAGALTTNITLQTPSSDSVTTGNINIGSAITTFPTTGVNTCTLPDGNNGQFKTLVRTGASNSMTVTVTTAGWNFGAGGTISFGDRGDSCFLQFISGWGWTALGAGQGGQQPVFS